MLITNNTIAQAALLVLDTHRNQQHQRPLRPLIAKDFANMRELKEVIARGWATECANVSARRPRADYYILRKRLLDQAQTNYGWSAETRNLYASILSRLSLWEKHGVSKKDAERLRELIPGAEVAWLQFVEGYTCGLL